MSDNRFNEEELKRSEENNRLESEKTIVIKSVNSDTPARTADVHDIHVSVIGDHKTGKTSLLSQYFFNELNYPPLKYPTGHAYIHPVITSHQQLNEQLALEWHVTDQNILSHRSFNNEHTSIEFYLFDYSSAESLHHIPAWLKQAESQRMQHANTQDTIKILVGTMSDKPNHEVKDVMIEKIKSKYHFDDVVKVSALTNKGIDDLFKKAAMHYLTRKNISIPRNDPYEKFKNAYKEKYSSAILKNPFSAMKTGIDKKYKTIEDVRKHAQEHPKSRTAQVLKEMEDQPESGPKRPGR